MSKEMFELLLEECKDSQALLYVVNAVNQVAKMGPYEVCDFAEEVKLVDIPVNIRTFEDAMIGFGDIVHVYEFMFLMVDSGVKNFNLERFEEIIRNSKNPKLMCYCLGFVPGINQDKMLEALYNEKNAKYIERLQDEEYELDVDTLPGYYERLEEAKKFDYFPHCLEQFGTRDVNELISLVIGTKSPYLINELADYMEYLGEYKGVSVLDLEPLHKAELEYGEPLHWYEYAASVSSAPKDKFTECVKSSGRVKYMYYMYEYVPGVDKGLLKEAIKDSGNSKYICKMGTEK